MQGGKKQNHEGEKTIWGCGKKVVISQEYRSIAQQKQYFSS